MLKKVDRMIEYENLKKVNAEFEREFRESFDLFLQSGSYILDKEVEKFESNFSSYNKSRYCIGVGNGTDALTLALKAADLQAGDEVIVPSNTYIAPILSVINLGLRPVFVEPDIRTYTIDPEKIKKNISPASKAIIVVHLYGKPCQMEEIVRICNENKLALIEDCAQAHGAEYHGQKVGNFGIGAFSFYPTKNLGALGDAGGLTCNDFRMKEKLRALRNYGAVEKNRHEYVGYNSRLDEIQARFLNIKLKSLDKINQHKKKLAAIYLESLQGDFILPVVQKNIDDVFHIFAIRHEQRDKLRAFLLKNGVNTAIHYPVPPHLQPCMKGLTEGEFPISEKIHETILSLPISYGHSVKDIETVCKVLNRF